MPAPPRGVDRSQRGEKHVVYGEVWTVEYSVLDQMGRKRHCCATGYIITARTRLTTSCWGALTGEIVGFSNDGGYFPEDYLRIMQLLKEHPIGDRYDVPELGLMDVTVDQILAAIYEQYVLAPRREDHPVRGEGVRSA